MFKVQGTILSEDIATAKFACNLLYCKGACCVVGDAGAPVSKGEMPVLEKVYEQIKHKLRPRAREVVEQEGLVWGNNQDGYELATTDKRECVFVSYTDERVAHCAIQEAYIDGEIDWEKPLSCHLFPIRLKRIADFEYANFEYVPSLCASACVKGERDETFLSEFLKEPLTRRYGQQWYKEFEQACEKIRTENSEAVKI